jgi:hypothetical protein
MQTNISAQTLREAAALKERIEALTQELDNLLNSDGESRGGYTTTASGRRMSAEGRARIAAAQRARWAKFRGSGEGGSAPKRTMSEAQRAKIAAAARLRWKNAKASGRNHL